MDILFFKQIEMGPMANFIYYIGCNSTKECAIVDPAWEPDRIYKDISDYGFTLSKILLTHGHPDHVNGLETVLKKQSVPVYISGKEAPFYTPKVKEIKKTHDGDLIPLGNLNIEVIHTPGHTPGGQCFLINQHLITGDTIFIDGCGRVDLPGGNAAVLFESLREKISPLDDDIVIYPGHNYGSKNCDSIENQKKTNPYLQVDNKSKFENFRSGV